MKKQKMHPESDLYKIRHSLAHVMAQAVQSFYPDVKLGIGPPIQNGFYYDFVFPEPLAPEDLKKIEKKMKKIIKEKQEFESFQLPEQEALDFLEKQQEPYKVELCKEFIAAGETIRFYKNGPFVDMCEGPHVEHTRALPFAFRLDSIAGAYWRGNEANIMMTRIYGLAFETKDELQNYVKRRDLAIKRDHRKLSKDLKYFFLADEIGKGLPLWLPNGTSIRDSLEDLAKETEFAYGYKRVATPHLSQSKLYHTSGHLPYYKDSMYPPMLLDEHEEYYLKPMNCPHHHLICRHLLQSYRDLPLRLAEYGQVYRYEKSGELAGLLRVRGMCMNDAHIYCDQTHVVDELADVMKMHKDYYDLFGLNNYWVRLSVHDMSKDKFVTNLEEWETTVNYLRHVLRDLDIPFEETPGEAAFYGPKIDFQVSNVVGREETASTNQLDFTSGHRFNLEYTNHEGLPKIPYIIHRAPLGTHERFISFLIEHYGGAFPTWMAPTQVLIIPVGQEFVDYANILKKEIHAKKVRVEADLSSDSLNKKIRRGTTQKIPNLLIVGKREQEENSVTHRRYGVNEQQTRTLHDFISWIRDEIDLRRNSIPLNPLDAASN